MREVMNVPTISIRPRFHREFFKWFEENRHRFAVPVILLMRRERGLKLGFVGVSPAIHASLGRHDGTACLEVGIKWDGRIWGFPFSLCTPDYHSSIARKPNQDRAALWKEFLFEPFLEWVNGSLAPAICIGLFRKDESASERIGVQGYITWVDSNEECYFTWSRLDSEISNLQKEKHLVHILPVRPDSQ